MREDFDGLREEAKRVHAERVAKTPERIEYAIKQFKANGIQYKLKHPDTGHFHCYRKSDGQMFLFWAGTGNILGPTQDRGIRNLIRMLTEGCNEK